MPMAGRWLWDGSWWAGCWASVKNFVNLRDGAVGRRGSVGPAAAVQYNLGTL